ncbi:MAG: hypothetical protein FRX49_11555 [Trebouxia sp. A1-2]|nr:MAG: hypothetical protein FRX49_11555 [Trebouxia sp. A1-2]
MACEHWLCQTQAAEQPQQIAQTLELALHLHLTQTQETQWLADLQPGLLLYQHLEEEEKKRRRKEEEEEEEEKNKKKMTSFGQPTGGQILMRNWEKRPFVLFH